MFRQLVPRKKNKTKADIKVAVALFVIATQSSALSQHESPSAGFLYVKTNFKE